MKKFFTPLKNYKLWTCLGLLIGSGSFYSWYTLPLPSEKMSSFWKDDMDEYTALDETFQAIMIRRYGLYTLVGLKPITDADLEKAPSLESAKEWLHSLPKDKQKQRYKWATRAYKKLPPHLKKRYTIEDIALKQIHKYRYESLKFWEKNWQNYTGPNYFFTFSEGEDFYEVSMVNKIALTYVLHKYYNDFKEAFEQDFDIQEMIEELRLPYQDRKTNFWSTVYKKSHYLKGLLYGFGEKSAYLFQLRNEKKIPFKQFGTTGRSKKYFFYPCVRIEDLPLPACVRFELYDTHLEEFIKARKHLIRLSKQHNFVDLTCYLLSLPREDGKLPNLLLQNLY